MNGSNNERVKGRPKLINVQTRRAFIAIFQIKPKLFNKVKNLLVH